MLNKFLIILIFFTLSCKEKNVFNLLEISIDKKEDSVKANFELKKNLKKDSIIELFQKEYPKASVFIKNEMVIITDTINNKIERKSFHCNLKKYDSIVITKKVNKILKLHSLDTFHIAKMHPIYHSELKDSIFYINSQIFEINEIKCQWKYKVKYIDKTNENSKEILVNLVGQKLIESKTNKILLDLNLSLFPYLYPENITNLENNDFKPQNFDINFDGFNDFQIYDRVSGGANHEYFVYVYNPALKRFEFSRELTGGSMANEGIELDKEKRIAYYSGKSGGGLYGFRRVHFNLDGSIKYIDRFWNEELDYYSYRDSINYYKYVFYFLRKKNNKTIDSLRVEKELNGGGLESIYRPFFEWINTFDK